MHSVFMILSSGDTTIHYEASFPYARNAKAQGWMDEVRVILWGPTERLAAEDPKFREEIKKLIDAGIDVRACRACSDNFKVTRSLEELGVNVQYVGKLVSQMLKEGWHQLSF